MLNPFRWKSQYYDADTQLYYIGGRWYDPERSRYISAASPEMLFQNAGTVFGINPYVFVLDPVNLLLNCVSAYPSLDFYYGGKYTTWWEQWGRWVLLGISVCIAITAVALAPFTCGASSPGVAIGLTLMKIALDTFVGTAVSLAICGVMGGIQSAQNGYGFWSGFFQGMDNCFIDALIMSFAFASINALISNILRLPSVQDGLTEAARPELGNKLEYALGNSTGNEHSVERSLSNATQLGRIGIHDNELGRQILTQHFNNVFYSNQAMIMGAEVRVNIYSLLAGPGGFCGVRSTWDGIKLITIILYGG